MSTRNEKGKVAVESINGWLRLRWRVGGKQYSLRIGLPDCQANQVVAQNKANQIYLDIISENFDSSLDKYRPGRTKILKPAKLTLIDVYDKFCHHKIKELDPRTYEKYVTVGKQLKIFHQEKDIGLINSGDIEGFWQYLDELGLEKITRKGKAVLLASFGQWAVEQSFLEKNHWQDMPKWVRLSAPETPKPFSPDETKKILEGFKTNKYYSYYYPFVLFSFNTGARIAEVIGLQWKRVAEDLSIVEISESLSRRVRKPTKTNRTRQFKLGVSISEVMRSHKPASAKPEDLVFQTPKGNAIDDHNFRNRAWVTILKEQGVTYRKPYNMRSTFISHALSSGMNPMTVAQITGHDPKTMFSHYAGFINNLPTTPELF